MPEMTISNLIQKRSRLGQIAQTNGHHAQMSIVTIGYQTLKQT